MSSGTELFLRLVRLGIGKDNSACNTPNVADWRQLKDLADAHGLSAVVLDGIEKGPNLGDSLPLEQKLEWIGEVLQNYEQRYSAYEKAISDLAGFYNQHGIKMMVIKGYGLSLNYPKPSHRPCGDIDVWLFGQQREADAALAASSKFQDSGFKIDTSHHHHTVFEWEGFSVENHYDFNNVHHHKSSAELEKIFKELGKDDSYSVEVCGEKVYMPSPNLHTLFLLKHSMTDFAAFYVTLRQVLDWGFHVKKHHNEIDWEWLKDVMDKYHMTEFFNCINAICVEDLGFNASIFPYIQFNPMLKEKVLNDILSPEFTRESPKSLIPRLIHKYRRWKGNAWKHEMCYNESMWSAFWSGVKLHLLKPASI